jgi:plastocyanin
VGRLTRGAAVLLALGLVAACARPSASGSPVATTKVDLPASYRFEPADITVPAGSTVTWTNHDNFTHSVQFLDGPGGQPMMMKPGESTTFTFTSTGLVHYQCSLHPQQMKGTVTVTSP